MQKTITAIFSRPTVDVLWFDEYLKSEQIEIYQSYVNENFVANNNMSVKKTLSDDGLMITVERIFTSAGFDKWLNDPIISESRAKMLEYNKKHNIVILALDIRE